VRKWHVDGDILYIQESFKDYQGQNIRLVGVCAPWEFNTKNPNGQAGKTTAGSSTFDAADDQINFSTLGIKTDDVLWLWDGADDADKKYWIIKRVPTNTTLEVYGKFAETKTNVRWYINYYTTVPEMYLVHKAASELFQFSGHKGAGQDIVEDMQWAEFHAQMAEYYIDMQGKPYPSRRTA